MLNTIKKQINKIESELVYKNNNGFYKLDALLIDALKSEVQLLEGAIDKNRIMRERLRRKLYLIFFKRSNTLSKPPTSAEFIARLFIPRKNRDSILGDLEEDYHKHVEKLGERRAKLIYWADVVRSVWPFVSAFVLKLIKLLYNGFVSNFSASK